MELTRNERRVLKFLIENGRATDAELSKKLNITITELLTSVLLESMQDILFSVLPPGGKIKIRPIRVLVPVNLRNIYKTSTMHNFTLYKNRIKAK